MAETKDEERYAQYESVGPARLRAWSVLLGDALGPVTRKERNRLMGLSMIGIAIKELNILPNRISALGIEFTQTNRLSMLRYLGFVVLYFLIAFFCYGVGDAARNFYAYLIELQEDRKGIAYVRPPFVTALLVFRIFLIDLLFPLVLGIYAAVILLQVHP